VVCSYGLSAFRFRSSCSFGFSAGCMDDFVSTWRPTVAGTT
jgi:hypothetical protein